MIQSALTRAPLELALFTLLNNTRVNFLFLLCCFCVVWFGWVLFYAILILIAGDVDRQCVRIGGAEFGAAGTELADAFQLSWTTIRYVTSSQEKRI